MFDRRGRFASVPWSIARDTVLGRSIHLRPASQGGATAGLDLPQGGTATNPIPRLVSQFGVVLYDRQTFLAQGATSTEGDFIFPRTYFDTTVYPANRFPTSIGNETTEETWLDHNSLPLLINRYDGSIIKGE